MFNFVVTALNPKIVRDSKLKQAYPELHNDSLLVSPPCEELSG